MTGLDPITLEAALPMMGKALGLTVAEDRSEIVDLINKYREILYTQYDKFKLFNNTYHCICVSKFYQECVDCCESCYRGVTLPQDIVSVENIWSYGRPLTLHTRWREGQFGINKDHCSPVSAIEMAETFPIERDLKEVTSLRVFTEREEDADKCLKIRAIDCEGKERILAFTLISDGWAVSKVKVKKILSVSLPPDRKGYITLSQKDGYELSQYTPYEVAPNYRRFKINGSCGTVLIQGVKRFQPIFFDHDIVEIGNGLIIEAAGKYFKYGDDSSDTNEINVANMWLGKMNSLLNGLIARHRGGSVQDVSPMLKKNIGRTTLPGYQKR